MKSIFVNPANDENYSRIGPDAVFPALAPISLATTMNEIGLEASAFDQQLQSLESILAAIEIEKPDLVGISVLSTNYTNALKIAEAAKKVNAKVILGNDHANQMARLIMEKRPEIDYIYAGDIGEYGMQAFAKAQQTGDLSQVPKLVWRDGSTVIENRGTEIMSSTNRWNALDNIPLTNRLLYPKTVWENATNNYNQVYGKWHTEPVQGVAILDRFRGCSRVKNPCMYCDIEDLSPRFTDPTLFWKDVDKAKTQVGADFFYVVGDSINAPNLERILKARLKGIGKVEFMMYLQAAETTPKLVNIAKKLGVVRFNMGIDSGSDTTLQRLKGPRDKVEKSTYALSLLQNAGITVYASFVLGAPGENEKTLSETIAFTKKLVDGEYLAGIEAQPLLPFPKSIAGDMLLNPIRAYEYTSRMGVQIRNKSLLQEMNSRYGTIPFPNFAAMARDWATIFCDISYGRLVEASSLINAYAESKGVSGGSAWIEK